MNDTRGDSTSAILSTALLQSVDDDPPAYSLRTFGYPTMIEVRRDAVERFQTNAPTKAEIERPF